jgi:hypothetical protein
MQKRPYYMLNRTFRFNFEKFQVNLAEILVFTGLFLWTVQIYFDDSGYLDLTGELPLKLIRYFCMFLFMGAIYFTEKSYTVKLAGAICLGGAFIMGISKMSNDGINLLQLMLTVLAVRNVSFRKTAKAMFWFCLFMMLAVILADAAGLIYVEPMLETERIRYFLGFKYVSLGPIKFFNIAACGLYAYTDPESVGPDTRGKVHGILWIFLAFLFGANYWYYRMTDTNLIFYLICVMFLLYVLCVKFNLNLFADNILIRFLASIGYPLLCVFTYVVAVLYDPKNSMWVRIDDWTHTRVQQMSKGVTRLGVHLLGQVLEENPNAADMSRYFYIDSAYMKNLLKFGIIYTVLLMIVFSIMFRAAVRAGDRVMCIWLFCTAAYSVFNNNMTSLVSNCAVLYIWTAVRILRDKERPLPFLSSKRRRPPLGEDLIENHE